MTDIRITDHERAERALDVARRAVANAKETDAALGLMIEEVERLRTEAEDAISATHAIAAIGWLSAELATRADAWDHTPDWFPEPPEWLELWGRALEATE